MFSALVVFIVLGGLVYFGLRAFEQANIYFPDRVVAATPREAGLAFEDIHLTSQDGVAICGWWMPHSRAQATVLFLHGNGGNISHRMATLAGFHEHGFSVFIIDYRGYGQSAGRPSEQGLYRDALAAYGFLADKKNILPDDVVLFGESLGGMVAADLASRVKIRAIITEGSPSSAVDMGEMMFPFLPVRRFLKQRFEAADKLARVSAPKLIIHSRDDEIVPFALGERLFQAAKEPKEFWAISGSHCAGPSISGELYWDKIEEFLAKSDIANRRL